MERPEWAIARSGQSRESVVPFEQRVVGKHWSLAFGEPCPRQTAGVVEGYRSTFARVLADAFRHPQALLVDLAHGSPVDRRRARTQHLVHAVPETHALHEREPVR